MKFIVGATIAWFVWGVCRAEATLVTSSLPGSTVIPFPSTPAYNGGVPQSFGPPSNTITWSSTNTGDYLSPSIFGYYDSFNYSGNLYDFGSNGTWNNISMAGLNGSSENIFLKDTMTFEFSSPVMGVGGLLNYFPSSTIPTISVFDILGNLIESAVLNFSTGGGENTGKYAYFSEGGNIIKSFTLTDSYIGITDFTIAQGEGSPVPEPATVSLLGTGIIGLLSVIRRND